MTISIYAINGERNGKILLVRFFLSGIISKFNNYYDLSKTEYVSSLIFLTLLLTYTRQKKKKRTSKISSLSSPFNAKMLFFIRYIFLIKSSVVKMSILDFHG